MLSGSGSRVTDMLCGSGTRVTHMLCGSGSRVTNPAPSYPNVTDHVKISEQQNLTDT